ncbi:hypothetical protein V5799_025935 [Amblyomma americanum]|uniref:Uncharacterized protein n=1 Tax=Amblyomma americanum TaxID=6943 RepID=A0AAQ4DK07_AMBAM
MSNTRVKRKGEKTVVYMGGQQLHGSGSNIVVSCGPGTSQSRGTVYRLPNADSMQVEAGMPPCLQGCRTTVSLENMPSSEPQIVRVVPRGTTILLEEVKPPPKAKSRSARSRSGMSRKGSPTVQVVQECMSGPAYMPPMPQPAPPPPPPPEPGPAEHCIECLAELIQRRRTSRRLDRQERQEREPVAQTEMRLTARVMNEEEMMPANGGCSRCPTCGSAFPGSARDREW